MGKLTYSVEIRFLQHFSNQLNRFKCLTKYVFFYKFWILQVNQNLFKWIVIKSPILSFMHKYQSIWTRGQKEIIPILRNLDQNPTKKGHSIEIHNWKWTYQMNVLTSNRNVLMAIFSLRFIRGFLSKGLTRTIFPILTNPNQKSKTKKWFIATKPVNQLHLSLTNNVYWCHIEIGRDFTHK